MRLLLFLSLLACDADKNGIEEEEIQADQDGDGILETDGDCDDQDPSVFTGAEEVCDGIDNDCDGDIDEGLEQTFYVDEDNDGYGDDSQPLSECDPSINVSEVGGDCDDQDQSVSPSAHEICDGIDNDCNGATDENMINAPMWFEDQDEDGFGNLEVSTSACEMPVGYVGNALDCNDLNATIAPDQPEVCDARDNDCDGQVDEADAVDIAVWYADDDEDGFGDANTPSISCEAPNKHVSNTLDCDDQDPNIHPDAPEECDGIDNNCDAMIDGTDSIDVQNWYQDSDGDGFGTAENTLATCYTPNGFLADSTDCDDTNAAMYPNLTETCDGLDNNCDGVIDEGVQNTYYLDADGDGFGTLNTSTASCSAPSMYVNNADDCNDLEPSAYTNAIETCDGVDNDCNGQIDEGVQNTYYLDADGDGYGTANFSLEDCSAPSLYVSNADDCNDLEPTAYSNAVESCDGIDNDCNGQIDEGVLNTYYLDMDGDGYGTVITEACTTPNGYSSNAGDCDDSNPSAYPSANEICDGIDNNCSGSVDDDDPLYDTSSDIMYYFDNDGDGFGDDNTTTLSCVSPGSDYVLLGQDCDDQNNAVAPDSIEECNDLDDNCDGVIDETFVDINGLYSFDDHCGGCNSLCDDEIVNGIGQCVVDSSLTPSCEVVSYDPGYTIFPNGQGCGLEVQAYQAQGRPGHCGWSTSPTYCSSDSSLLGSCWQNGFSYGTCIIGYDCPNTITGDTGFSIQGGCSSYF